MRITACLLVVFLFVAPGPFAQEVLRPTGRMVPGSTTPTPTPDPCAACPDPDSFSCQMWPLICQQCWEDCGSPIATPTPTPTRTPTPPPPTPTPQGPACELRPQDERVVYLVAFYLHESKVQGTRYSYRTDPILVAPQTVLRPCPCQGHPVGCKWYTSSGELIKSCGDTSTKHWHIFSDGFESGGLEEWDGTRP